MANTDHNISKIVSSRLCIGCGACEPACPDKSIKLFDFIEEGIRPVVNMKTDSCESCLKCLDVCPGEEVDFRLNVQDEGPYGKKAIEEWGPVLEIWEGHASDEEIRFKGSSGGALTALALYCLEKEEMHGVLHTGQDDDDPARNRTRLSTSREAVIKTFGSRYSPASVCNGLNLIENSPKRCVFIGKPSEVAALRKSQHERPKLDEKVGLAMSFYCAESPPTQGTLDLVKKLGVGEDELGDLKYRGGGWPGYFAPVKKGKKDPENKMTYQESWGILQAYRPWATHIWPDGGGELADISCGDPWYDQPDGENPGSSLVIVRTERGREIVRKAMAEGYIKLTKADLWKLEKSQPNILSKKANSWGRMLVMRLCGMKITRYKKLNHKACWSRRTLGEKVKSVLGTLKRILKKDLKKPLNLNHDKAIPVKDAFNSD